MEQGAGLVLDGDLLTVTARNDIYIRYLNDNKTVIAELASEHLGRAIRVELSTNGAAKPAAGRTTIPLGGNGLTRELPAAAADTNNPVATKNAQRQTAPSKPIESTKEIAPTTAGDGCCAARSDARGTASGAGGSRGAKSVRYAGRAAGGTQDTELRGKRRRRHGIKVVRRAGEPAARSDQSGRNRFVGIDAAGASAAGANEGDAGNGVSENR